MLVIALERDVSVYDGCNVALAEGERAVLVTADRRLVAAEENVQLIPYLA